MIDFEAIDWYKQEQKLLKTPTAGQSAFLAEEVKEDTVKLLNAEHVIEEVSVSYPPIVEFISQTNKPDMQANSASSSESLDFGYFKIQ